MDCTQLSYYLSKYKDVIVLIESMNTLGVARLFDGPDSDEHTLGRYLAIKMEKEHGGSLLQLYCFGMDSCNKSKVDAWAEQHYFGKFDVYQFQSLMDFYKWLSRNLSSYTLKEWFPENHEKKICNLEAVLNRRAFMTDFVATDRWMYITRYLQDTTTHPATAIKETV